MGYKIDRGVQKVHFLIEDHVSETSPLAYIPHQRPDQRVGRINHVKISELTMISDFINRIGNKFEIINETNRQHGR